MSGYYPGTFGFENDDIGSNPDGWLVDENYGTIQVIDSLDGHKNVVEIHDTSAIGVPSMKLGITPQTVGTAELWVRITDADDSILMQFHEFDSGRSVFFTQIRFGIIRTTIPGPSYDTTITIIDPALDNTWYHIKWEFSCITHIYNVYINGVLEGSNIGFSNNVSSIEQMFIRTSNGDLNYYAYLDALSFSWDPNYDIGDNMNEGLLLSYENTTNLNWKGFSLDGQANRTIPGNTTIKMPNDGVHNIQVFGNNSLGTMYESNKVYFTIDTSPYIYIVTPENKTYTDSDSGYYPATYGFENDQIGSILPTEWEDLSYFSGGTHIIIDEIGGHKNILEFHDTSASGYPGVWNDFNEQTSGTIEWWWRFSDVNKISQIKIGGDAGTTIHINARNGEWMYYDIGSTSWAVIQKSSGGNIDSPLINTWYHLSLDFSCDGSGYKGLGEDVSRLTISKEGVSAIQSVELLFEKSSVNYLNSTWIFTNTGSSNFYAYIDAIGYSWYHNYNIGDNLNEGLLLGYDTNTDFNWASYSLDGQTNKTILGNTTIKMPNDGVHNIQVFGNNSLGSMYESSLRYFTTNALGPLITINSPLVNSLIGIAAPSFALAIPDGDLDKTWYSLDGGTTIIPFTGLSGIVDQVEWNKISNGTATIMFYANDTLNNLGHAEVIVRKDIIAPDIIITDPSNTEEFEFTPIFDITVNEPNLDEIWYTIDGGAHNYSISETVGTINLAAWNGAPSGPVTIRFYARDLAGNIGTSFVIVVKTSEQQQPPPGIPGYNLIALIGALSVISALLIRKRLKS